MCSILETVSVFTMQFIHFEVWRVYYSLVKVQVLKQFQSWAEDTIVYVVVPVSVETVQNLAEVAVGAVEVNAGV